MESQAIRIRDVNMLYTGQTSEDDVSLERQARRPAIGSFRCTNARTGGEAGTTELLVKLSIASKSHSGKVHIYGQEMVHVASSRCSPWT